MGVGRGWRKSGASHATLHCSKVSKPYSFRVPARVDIRKIFGGWSPKKFFLTVLAVFPRISAIWTAGFGTSTTNICREGKKIIVKKTDGLMLGKLSLHNSNCFQVLLQDNSYEFQAWKSSLWLPARGLPGKKISINSINNHFLFLD